MDNNLYWKNMKDVQVALNNNEEFQLVNPLKEQILLKIKESLTDTNFLISKLLIYGKINDENLLNLLFYISLNTSFLYKLFIKDTDKFCRKFMFNIAPNELPEFNKYYLDTEVATFEKLIGLTRMIVEINETSNEKYKMLFPKSYRYNILTNPFLKADNK